MREILQIKMQLFWKLVTHEINRRLKSEYTDYKYVAEVCRNRKVNHSILSVKNDCIRSVVKSLKKDRLEPVESVEKYLVN